jgi:hypothetical protein
MRFKVFKVKRAQRTSPICHFVVSSGLNRLRRRTAFICFGTRAGLRFPNLLCCKQ